MRDDVIFDLGLHRGEDTAYYLAKGYNVIAFEADPRSVAFCQNRFQQDIASKRLTIVAGAITEDRTAESVNFYESELTEWGTAIPKWGERNRKMGVDSHLVSVAAIDMMECFQRFGVPYYLKIDIEGSDRYVLQTLSRLTDRPRYLSFETDKVDFDGLLEDLGLVESLGYRRFKVVQQATIPGRVISTTDRSGNKLTYQHEAHASGGFGDDAEGAWVSKQDAIAIYRRIFTGYRLYGGDSILQRYCGLPIRIVSRILKQPLPGWHDIHASFD